jgi:mono/diheme cytochrome c family protein
MIRKSCLFWSAALLVLIGVQTVHAQSNGSGSKTIWDGVYTSAQATRGEQAAKQNCASCHAVTEWSNTMFITAWSGKSISELHTQIRTTMPFDAPGRLTPSQYADIVAYILKINNIPAGEVELPSEDSALQRITVTSPAHR